MLEKNTIIVDPKRKRVKSSEVDLLLGSYKLLNDLTGWKPKVNLMKVLLKQLTGSRKIKIYTKM